jgi:hypothetical protein
MTMLVRLPAKVAAGVLTATLAVAVTAGGGLQPSQAKGSPHWQIAKIYRHIQQFDAVSAKSARDAWVIGQTNSGPPVHFDVERWNGAEWQHIAVPPDLGTVRQNFFTAIGSSSLGNAWTFPTLFSGTREQTYALHWDNGRWMTTKLPPGSAIADTAVFSRGNAWAFGAIRVAGKLRAFDLRWRGRRWRQVSLPAAPFEVNAFAPDDMWAVGTSAATLAKPRDKQVTMAMHWNGRAWAALRVPVPQLPRAGVLDDYIAATGPRDFWLAYVDFDRNYNFVSNGMLHWNGTRWRHVKLPAHFVDFLMSMSQDGKGGLFICSPSQIYHYAAGRWTQQQLPGPNPLRHIVVDSLAWIPGTTSALAVGERNLHGLILRYTP